MRSKMCSSPVLATKNVERAKLTFTNRFKSNREGNSSKRSGSRHSSNGSKPSLKSLSQAISIVRRHQPKELTAV